MKRNNRKIISILLTFCLIGTLPAGILYSNVKTSAKIDSVNEIWWQQEERIGDSITWRIGELSNRNYILELSGTGKLSVQMMDIIGHGEVYCNITQIIIKDGITDIGPGAFALFYSLKTIYIPDSVKTIGESCFNGCKRLEAVRMSENIEEIGNFAFDGCIMLEYIDLPKSLHYIGSCAFHECSYLYEEKFELDLTKCDVWHEAFDQNAIEPYIVSTETLDLQGTCGEETTWRLQGEQEYYTLTISGQGEVTSTPWEQHMTDIKEVIIEEGITKLPDSCFYHAYELRKIKMPETLTEIPSACFCNCSKLEKINLPNNIVNIGDCAFVHDMRIKEIILPPSVTHIGWGAFWDCVSVEKLVSNAAQIRVDDRAFLNNMGLDPDEVKKNVPLDTGDYANVFENCYGINSLEDAYLDPWTESDIISIETMIQKIQSGCKKEKPNNPEVELPTVQETFNPEKITKMVVSQLKAMPVTNKNIVIKWDKLVHATGYRIYRSTKAGRDFKLVKTVNGNVNEYTDSKLKSDKKYYYQVSAVYQGQKLYESIKSNSSSTTYALSSPILKLVKGKTVNKILYLGIKVKKYQGEYMEIYLRKNNGGFKKYFVNKKKLAKSKGNFKFSYKKKDVNIYVQIRTYRKKNGVKKYSGFSEVKSIHL